MSRAAKSTSYKRTGMAALIILTSINLLNYLDRFILPALIPAIQKDIPINDAQIGFLGTCFILVYFATAPLFGWLGDRMPRYRVMAAGVALWSFATSAASWARTYPTMLLARGTVGIGEAAYATISPALIGDLFPKKLRGRVFSIFFMAIPVGSALGYLLGGMLEARYGWRKAFLFAGVPGLLVAACLLFFRDPPRGQYDDEADKTGAGLPVREVYAALWKNRSYALTVLGYAAYTFVVGGLAFWMPTYLVRYHNVSLEKGNIVFGGITVVAGFLGTIIGGFWGDRWDRRSGDGYLKISALSMLVSVPLFLFTLHAPSFNMFALLLFFLEFFLFLSTSPVNAQVINSVPVFYRATASAVCNFSIHLLGDAISPTLMGAISDKAGLVVAMYLCPFGLFIAAMVWFSKVIWHWETVAWPEGALKLPRSQCHRGCHPAGVQENTLEAFQLAKKNGAVMVELDVRLSLDGIPVVFHDEDISQFSSHNTLVCNLPAAELKKIVHAPSLEEVLRDPESTNFINIEIKNEGYGDGRLERKVADIVRLTQAESRVLFSSFNPFSLRRLAQRLPKVPRALLVTNEDDPKNKFYLKEMLLAFLARPHLVHMDKNMFTAEMAAKLSARSIKVAVWTVDTQEEAKKCLALGAESIISPLPAIVEGNHA